MAKLTSVSEVGIFTRDMKLSREFYTRKIGMKVRSSMPKFEYLQLGVTKGGEDAGLDIWHPVPSWGEQQYQDGLKAIGIVAGIGFRTGNIAKTVEQLSRRGVKVEREADAKFARFRDPDGNVLFIEEPERPRVRRTGLQAIDFVTVAVRDEAQADAFFTKALGMKGKRVRGEEGQSFATYRLSPGGTAVMPFMPRREVYENPADYDADMAHIGEVTTIGFEVDDIYGVQDKLLAKGVRFTQKAKQQDWGGISARICDPDSNEYMIYRME